MTLPDHFVAVSALGVAGAYWDLRVRRVPNALTFGAAGVALIAAVTHGGWAGLLDSTLGYLTGLALFVPLFALGGMGGGDVKLLAAFGAWLGPSGALWAAMWSSMIGGVMAVALAVSRGILVETVGNVGTLVGVWRNGSLAPVPGFTLADASRPRLAYAVPIAAGAMLAIWFN